MKGQAGWIILEDFENTEEESQSQIQQLIDDNFSTLDNFYSSPIFKLIFLYFFILFNWFYNNYCNFMFEKRTLRIKNVAGCSQTNSNENSLGFCRFSQCCENGAFYSYWSTGLHFQGIPRKKRQRERSFLKATSQIQQKRRRENLQIIKQKNNFELKKVLIHDFID